MARRPANFTWLGFTTEQVDALAYLDFIGNNGWSRTSQTEVMMPKILSELADSGVAFARTRQAMEDIGYSRNALHQLERWESKRTTGKFGR